MDPNLSIKDFLKGLRSQRPIRDELLNVLVEFFNQNDLTRADQLRLLAFTDLRGTLPSAGAVSFVKQALEEANKQTAQQSLLAAIPPRTEASESMQALVKVLKKEDPTVHIKVGEHLRDMSLTNLPRDCWPKGLRVSAASNNVSFVAV